MSIVEILTMFAASPATACFGAALGLAMIAVGLGGRA